MRLIADTFSKHFSHWDITLPEKDLKKRSNGYIQKAGWLIQYCFGEDDKGEYLDYYAAHRMTDDSMYVSTLMVVRKPFPRYIVGFY